MRTFCKSDEQVYSFKKAGRVPFDINKCVMHLMSYAPFRKTMVAVCFTFYYKIE